jgi:hypothetical protein
VPSQHVCPPPHPLPSATQAPASALQTPEWHVPAPHAVPSLTAAPVLWHDDTPPMQLTLPTWQGLLGVQGAPAAQPSRPAPSSAASCPLTSARTTSLPAPESLPCPSAGGPESVPGDGPPHATSAASATTDAISLMCMAQDDAA